MKLVIFCPFYLVLLSGANYGWVAVEYPRIDTNYTAHCWSEVSSIGDMNLNETKQQEGKCVLAECNEDRSVTFAGCSKILTEPPCKITPEDPSKPYPDCCPDITCEID